MLTANSTARSESSRDPFELTLVRMLDRRTRGGSVCGARMFNYYDKEVCVGMSSFRIIFFVATRLKKPCRCTEHRNSCENPGN